MNASGRLRIALLQLQPKVGEVLQNRMQIRKALAVAAGYCADLAITPELMESGWGFERCIDLQTIPYFPNSFIVDLKEVAFKYQMHMMIGLPERDLATNGIYNAFVHINARGQLQTVYRKQNLNNYEKWMVPGDLSLCTKVEEIPITLLIGEDGLSEDIEIIYRNLDAQLIIVATAEGRINKDVWCQCEKETLLPMIVCDTVGERGECTSMCLVKGQVVGSFISACPQVTVIEFNAYEQSFKYMGSCQL